jgi:hypothetical protein
MKKVRLDSEFCRKLGLDRKKVSDSFVRMLIMMHHFILQNGYKINKDISVNQRALKEVVVDFHVDIARMKSFHFSIDEPAVEKSDAYKAYWLLRRKPLQVLVEDDKFEFINEYFVVTYLATVIGRHKGIDDTKKEKNQTWRKFCSLLYRNLKYRPISQQSLELMIEAFYCGCDFAAL